MYKKLKKYYKINSLGLNKACSSYFLRSLPPKRVKSFIKSPPAVDVIKL